MATDCNTADWSIESRSRRNHMGMYTALIQQIKEQKLSPSKLKSLEGPAGKMNDFLSKARVLTEQEVQRRKQLKSSK